MNPVRQLARRAAPLRVLMVASEMAPWAKTGGLGDVIAALPVALEARGHTVTVVVPRYRGIDPGEDAPRMPHRVRLGPRDHDVTLVTKTLTPARRVVFVDYPPFFDRDGYYGSGGRDYPDNAARFALLATVALDVADAPDELSDVIHAHDWQGGLAPALLALDPARWPRASRAGRVFTIHNLAFQGRFPREVVPALGLDWRVFTMEGGEFWNELSFLKCGIAYSDWVTTVSPSYAQETQTAEFGGGFEGVLRARAERYVGILNGIDTSMWNPAADPLLPAAYDADHLAGKQVCKRALLESFGLPIGDDAMARPVVGMVSRLVDQKGIDLVADVSNALMAQDATWIVVGTGEPKYEALWRGLAARHPTRVGVFIGFDEARAHLVEAGGDLFLMPSRFEPCGLNQMYSLRYGTVPIVHAVGGLDDTIRPYSPRSLRANGFKFRPATPARLLAAVKQALRVYHNRVAWIALMRSGMREDHSWDLASREYVKVYRRARRDARRRAAVTPPR